MRQSCNRNRSLAQQPSPCASMLFKRAERSPTSANVCLPTLTIELRRSPAGYSFYSHLVSTRMLPTAASTPHTLFPLSSQATASTRTWCPPACCRCAAWSAGRAPHTASWGLMPGTDGCCLRPATSEGSSCGVLCAASHKWGRWLCGGQRGTVACHALGTDGLP